MDAPIRTIKATFPLPTNLATLRSFAFKPLSMEGRFAHFHRNFPEVDLPIEVAERLARLEGLTPGDFKVVLTRPRFSPALEAEAVVASLAEECAY